MRFWGCRIEKNMAVDNLLLVNITYLWCFDSFTLNKAEIWKKLNRCYWECALCWAHAQVRLLLYKPQRRGLNENGRMALS